jgi:hypothetical protein
VTDPSKLGAYRLIASLGHGGMADVYLAVVEGPAGSGFTKLAVLKKPRSHLADDADFVSMLMDEARVTARLTHPNVVQLFEVGEAKDEHFLVMEYLDGQPLHRVVRRIEREAARGGASVPRHAFYGIVSDVLAGLHHAHELADYDGTLLAVVHRDVTPHNVFLTYDGVVKVVDFGIAKAVGRATETKHGIRKGKLRYMSPEQAAGGNIDRRTDIFAAGVILWNLATGLKFWSDRDDLEISRALQSGDFSASPREKCPEVPAEIDVICRKALAVRREDRYPTADAMRADLEAFLGSETVAARRALVALLKELFASDREKVRVVLRTAGLTTTASVAKLSLRKKRRAVAPRPRPAAVADPSVRPMVLARAAKADGAAKRRVPRGVERPASARLSVWRTVAKVLGCAVAAAAIVFAIDGRRGGSSSSFAPSAPRQAVSEMTAFSHDADPNAKQASSSDPVVRKRLVSASGRPGSASSVDLAQRRAAPRASPASATSAGSLLDKADPWRPPGSVPPGPAH